MRNVFQSQFFHKHIIQSILCGLFVTIVIQGCVLTKNRIPMPNQQSRYFASPKEAVQIINILLEKGHFRTLANYYDLSDSGIQLAELATGRFFIRTKKPEITHPGDLWRYKHPFSPGFRFEKTIATDKDNVFLIQVKKVIDQGVASPEQVGLDYFYMKKSADGWQLLPKKDGINFSQLETPVFASPINQQIETSHLPACTFKPPFQSALIPENGLIWLDEDFSEDPCGDILELEWMSWPGDSLDFFIKTKGPVGSGRYWTVLFGLAEKNRMVPDRGICLKTETLGWRILQEFDQIPIPWIADLDNDGLPELIIWKSFPVDSSSALMAWIYKLDSDKQIVLDKQLTQQFAIRLVASYQKPLNSAHPSLNRLRAIAVKLLNEFINGE
ncbi:hypothetical protein KKA14_07740 [bacterium]|nr:hypothetical protein [bacterium]